MNSSTSVTPENRNEPKRVCMIAYTNYVRDGRVRLEAESLVRWGYDVTFLVPKEEQTPKTYVMNGVKVVELNAQKYGGRSRLNYLFSYAAFMFSAFAACTALFFKSRINVIHVHNMPDVLVFAAIIPRMLGAKVVLDLHDTLSETFAAKFGSDSPVIASLLKLEERVCCALADSVICVNHPQRDAVIGRGIPAKKISTVITMPNFTSRKTSGNHNHGEKFRMVNHGTITNRLGNDLIVHAAAKLVPQIPGFELHFFGRGADGYKDVVRLTASLGLTDRVVFHDAVPWDQLPQELEAMDVGIVANRVNVATHLMLPAKLIDFVLLDIPAIVPRLKCIEYYFAPDMVSYFEPESVDSIVAATMALYQDKERMARQTVNAKRFMNENPWDDPVKGLRGLYSRLC